MKKYSKILIILIIALFLEVIVFNITSYRLLFGKYEEKTFVNPEFVNYRNEKAILKIKNLNQKIGTVKLELKNFDETTEYQVSYSDETSDDFRSVNSKFYVQNYEKSKYVPLYLSGNTKEIMISVDKSIYDENKIDKVIINSKIPFEFNIVRFISVFLFMLFIYSAKNEKLFSEPYSKKNFKHEIILLAILLIFMILLSEINSYSTEEYDLEGDTSFAKFLNTEGGIYNKDFVESVKEGKFYLLNGPDEKLLNLENPYDNITRDKTVTRDVDYNWDTAFYKGHEYIYFGILPLLLTFLPYNLIFHKYLKISIVVFIFSIFIFILLKEILLKILSKYFDNIPFKIVAYALIAFCSGTLILYANGMSRVYELVIIVRIILCFTRNLFYFKISRK